MADGKCGAKSQSTCCRPSKLRAYFLQNFPRGGRPIGEGIRILRVIGTPYLVIYHIEGEAVQVLRIRHEGEDWFVDP